MTNQPKWVKVGVVGDINPVDYGGGLVFEDKTGVYAPEVEYYLGDNGAYLGKIRIYRFSADKCTFVNGVLSDNRFHPELPAWFADKLPDDTTPEQFCSEDTMIRAMAWTEVGLYYGFENLDNYPIYLTRNEAIKRVGRK